MPNRATEARSARKSGVYTIRGADTLPVTKMWFGSREGDDCSNGQMKAVLKIRPLFQYKFPDRKCIGGTLDGRKDEGTIPETLPGTEVVVASDTTSASHTSD
jgi:hypothetical protein